MRIGIDFGGTKIEAAVIDVAGEFRSRIRTRNPGAYDAAIRAVCEVVDAVEREAGASSATVGVGVPGSISPLTGMMRNANTVWLNGRNFRADLTAALRREIRVANDANCLALSEVVDGAAVGSQITFAAVLGTGCGGGLVIHDRLVEGAHGVGGEWGHTPLPWPTREEVDAPACWCGQRGCLEVWISGSGLQSSYASGSGLQRSSEQIVEAARAGDATARAAFQRYVDRLGRALAGICNIVDPDTIVLGGGLSNVAELYADVPRVAASYVFSDAWAPKIVRARWGASSGVRGAARLWGR